MLLSMVNKKAQEFDKDMGQAMYECLLCDACTNDCATGYQPPLFIREARTEAVVSEVAPESVMNLIENVETTGNIYGVEKPSYGQDGTDVLVYIGEVAAIKVPEMAKHLLALLAKAGVSAKVLANEPASGVMLGDLMGYTEEVRKQAEVCAKALNETGLPVVVLDSYDAEIMTQKYPEWGCEITAGVTTATAFVAKLLEEKKLAAKAGAGTLVPITGFANAVVAPAIEFRNEGLVSGVGAKMFIIAGPVIVYGMLASVVWGVIYHFIRPLMGG